METVITPKEVIFDSQGYEDLISAIEALEQSEIDNLKVIEFQIKKLNNVIDNLRKVVNINGDVANLLVTHNPEMNLSIMGMTSEKPTLDAR